MTITDEFGCQIEVSNEIPAGDTLSLEGTAVAATNCQANGSVTVFVDTGTPPFTYQWSNGQMNMTNDDHDTINGLVEGLYSVTVSDAAGCSSSYQIMVESAGSDLAANVLLTQSVSCFGANDGVAMALPENGQAPYNFLWSNGEVNQSIINLSEETYTVTITDFDGCTATASIDINEPSLLNVEVTTTPLSSVNSDDGTATAIPQGGTPTYTYAWSNGESTTTISNLAPGQYTVTVSDANNCTQIQTATISSIDCSDFQTTISWNNLLCFAANDGSAMVEVSGETPPVTYNWSNGATGPMIENLSAGTYSATVTDGDGCSAELTALVQEPSELNLSLSTVNESTPGANDGMITATPGGGTPFNGGLYDYFWNNGKSTATITDLSPGTYSLTVTDANGCTITANATVASSNCQLAIEMEFQNASCPNLADGTASVTTVSNGTAPFTFNWSNGGTSAMIEDLLPGDYYVTVTDANGCSSNGWIPIIGSDTQAPTLNLFKSNHSADWKCSGSF